MYLMASTGGDITAKQLERELGVTYKTAWRMANLISDAFAARLYANGIVATNKTKTVEKIIGKILK